MANELKKVTDYIFIGKEMDELKYYDLVIINADYAEESVANDLKQMHDRNIIDDNTLLIICDSHGNKERSSADILDKLVKERGLTNKVIINRQYITNIDIVQNIDKYLDLSKYERILKVGKDFVARRWFMTAEKYNFPIYKCDYYGIVDGRNISKKDWYKSKEGITKIKKEFVNLNNLLNETDSLNQNSSDIYNID